MKKVIITGATGFIGSWLVKEMLQNQVEVIALVRDVQTNKFGNLENGNLLRLFQYHTDGQGCLRSRKMMVNYS